jgi:hypothetical protein
MSDSVDSLHPEQIARYMIHVYEAGEARDNPELVVGEDALSPHGDGVKFEDYEALWNRCEARAEVGYAVEANALREQIRQQREEFDRIVARERDAREKAEAERDGWRDQVAQAVELEQAAEELAAWVAGAVDGTRTFGMTEPDRKKAAAALARFRDTQKQEGQNDE